MGDPKRAAVTLDFEKPLVELEEKILSLQQSASENDVDVSEEVERLRKQVEKKSKEIFGSLEPWQRVQLARHPRRPTMLDYVERIFDDFKELHGDRAYRDDPSIVGGMARIGDRHVMVVGHQKGRDTKSNIRRNFGMPHPEGYRKALRLMELAAKFGRPIVTFVDTPGAFPGVGAEERGQAEAIARNLREMAGFRVPIIVFVTGEGGSGGALAIAVGDRVYMLENSIYSVISPEGCAAILWRSAEHREKAAKALKLTSSNLKALGVADRIIDEPAGGAHADWQATADALRAALVAELAALDGLEPAMLREQRWSKFEAMGAWRGEDSPEG